MTRVRLLPLFLFVLLTLAVSVMFVRAASRLFEFQPQPASPQPVQLEVHFARSPEYVSPEHKTYTRWEIHTRPGQHTSQEILAAILEMDAQLQKHAAAY
jgi:hypothetical protein